jgi:hypothetical protein
MCKYLWKILFKNYMFRSTRKSRAKLIVYRFLSISISIEVSVRRDSITSAGSASNSGLLISRGNFIYQTNFVVILLMQVPG